MTRRHTPETRALCARKVAETNARGRADHRDSLEPGHPTLRRSMRPVPARSRSARRTTRVTKHNIVANETGRYGQVIASGFTEYRRPMPRAQRIAMELVGAAGFLIFAMILIGMAVG